MATKKTPPPPTKKSGSNGRSASGAKSAAARSAPAKENPRKPASKPGAARASGARPASRTSRASAKPRGQGTRAIRQGVSLDRKLDAVGVVLALVGLLTFLALLSPINSSLTGSWVGALRNFFGLGMFAVPFILMGVGVWLVLRNFERIPQFALDRLLGFGLLFLNALASIHFIVHLMTKQDIFLLAQLGQGGGWLGSRLMGLLVSALGIVGAGVALAAWLVIALALSLDLTVWEMIAWVEPLVKRFSQALSELVAKLTARKTPAAPLGRSAGDETMAMPTIPNGFQPFVSSGPPPVVADPAQRAGSTPLQISEGGEPAVAWVLPPIDQILDSGQELDHDDDLDHDRALVIEDTLSSFGAPAKVVEINRGPTITQFGVEPDFVETRGGRMRVRVGKIASLADDLALALSARTIRIQAPVPGKSFVGIEVPNDQIATVALRDILESDALKRIKSPLRFALGQNVAGNAVAADLAGMPHLLVAGATGSGKSVCVNALICCLLINNTPDDLRLIMVDPKRVELTGYNGIPHLLAPVVVELEKVVSALQWVTREMDMRYRKLAEAGARNIQDYNARIVARGGKKLPFLVVIIDELADLMMLAPDETERTITRLAQLARATGIHLVIATQRPSVDVVTGLIKANFPARVAFAVASGIDSRVILDQPGAERLLGRGDMLFQAPDAPAPVRLQGVYVSDNEIFRLVTYWQSFSGASQTVPTAAAGIPGMLPAGVPLKQIPLWEEMEQERDEDPMLKEAIDLCRRQGRASVSMLQRRLRVGYSRASRLIEIMEERGIIGPPEMGGGSREVLDYGPAAPPVDD